MAGPHREPGQGPPASKAATERLLVCVGPGPEATPLVLAAQKLAATFEAEWRVLYIETPEQAARPPEAREEASRALRLAAQLGAPAHKRTGFRVLEEILQFAREHQITRIVVGRPRRRRFWERWRPSLVEQLLRRLAGKLDVYIIQAEARDAPRIAQTAARRRPLFLPLADYFWAAGGVAICTALAGLLFPHFSFTNLALLYLLLVIIMSRLLGRGPSIFASFLSIAAFAFFFVPEYWSFAIARTEYVLTLAVMLIVSGLISGLSAKVRYQSQAARQQERQTAALYEMNQALTALHSLDELLNVAVAQIAKIFQGQAAILMREDEERLQVRAGAPLPPDDEKEWAVARWVYRYGHVAGAGTQTLNEVKGLYLPLRTSQAVIGVLRVEMPDGNPGSEGLRLLEALANQVALAIERENLGQQAQQVRLQMEAERLRNTLLSSVSHDLRTPLTVIAGSASTLLEGGTELDAETKQELVQSIFEEAKRLDRLVHNLLEMSRLQSGEAVLHRDWQVVEEVLGCALGQLETQLRDRPLSISLPPDLPLMYLDGLLMERVFVNLLENAVKHTPPGSPVEISGQVQGKSLLLEFSDRGPGLPPGEEEKIFEKFYQSSPGKLRGGGLGLAICRSIVEAHGGRIWATNRAGGGAAFYLSLPLAEPPSLERALVGEQENFLHEATHPAD